MPSGSAPPQITQQPSNRTVPVGGTATFTVSATGATPLTHQWQKNGGDIPGATLASYTTPPAAMADNNTTYRCRVTNSAGTATSNWLSTTSFVDVSPNTATITLATSPAGLRVTLDGQPVTTPISVTSLVGIVRTLGVVSPQTSGASTYYFGSWSDGEQRHTRLRHRAPTEPTRRPMPRLLRLQESSE